MAVVAAPSAQTQCCAGPEPGAAGGGWLLWLLRAMQEFWE